MGNLTYPTTRQRKATEGVAGGQSVSQAMIRAGYDLTTAKNPKNLTESKGFKQLCKNNGLTESLIIKSLAHDIKAKKENSVPELRLGTEILGMINEENKENKILIINITGMKVIKD